jgi:CubicO group peptidase (beta-lactamase class C family)
MSEFTRDITGVTNEAVLERVMHLPRPDFPVGTQYAYGGTSYVLLAMIVAIVSGQSFGDFLKANVFDPLGMKHTVVYDASRPAPHKLAQAFWEEKGQFERWDYPLLTAGDGGLFSTLDDLFLWDQALNTERLVPKAAQDQAFTSGTTNDGTPVGYGFGWITNVFPYLSAAEREQLLALGAAGQRHVAHWGQLRRLLQLHHPFSRYPAHDHCADQSRTHRTCVGTTASSGHSRPTRPGASGRGNPLQ